MTNIDKVLTAIETDAVNHVPGPHWYWSDWWVHAADALAYLYLLRGEGSVEEWLQRVASRSGSHSMAASIRWAIERRGGSTSDDARTAEWEEPTDGR